MMKRYEMSDLGLLNHFLGLGIYQQVTGVLYSNTMLKLETGGSITIVVAKQ